MGCHGRLCTKISEDRSFDQEDYDQYLLDSEGILFIDYLEKSKTITSEYYLLLFLKTELQSIMTTYKLMTIGVRVTNRSTFFLFSRVGSVGLGLIPRYEEMVHWKKVLVKRSVAITNGYFTDVHKSYNSEDINNLE